MRFVIKSGVRTHCELFIMRTVLLVFMVKVHLTHSGLRIIGGRDALPDEFPYVVKLEVVLGNVSAAGRRSITFCSASVLSAAWSLTAAHCIQFLDRYSVKHPGVEHKNMIKTKPDGAMFAVLSTHKHPAFRGMLIEDFVFIENDVGVVKTEPVTLTQYAKLSAVDCSAVTGQAVSAVGYGLNDLLHKLQAMKDKPTPPPRPLRVLDLMVVECSHTWHLYPAMCVAQRCGDSASMCAGDSGGPLLHPSGIVAVTSVYTARDCAVEGNERSRTVGIMTAISPYISWITSHVVRK